MGFSVDVGNWCKKTAPDWIHLVTKRIVFECAERAVMRSPVGDESYWKTSPPAGYTGGRFRGNWQYQFGRPASGELSIIDKSGGSTIGKIQSSYSANFGLHTITNNLPYSERIENGWSRQAPRGIVRLIEIEMPSIAREAMR